MATNLFDEVRIEDGIVTRGTSGGPVFNTTIVKTQSGKEYRNQNWTFPLSKWNLGARTLRPAEHEYFRSFFMARGGMFRGFRFKDWGDYKDGGNGRLGHVTSNGVLVDTLDGSGYYKLFKLYNSGGTLATRRIAKPVSGTVVVKRGGTTVVQGSGIGECTVDYIKGVIHFTPHSTKSITSITRASNGVVTCPSHGLSTGSRAAISCAGMDEVSERAFTVTVIDANSFYLNENTSDYNAFSSGFLEVHIPTSEVLTWEGQFDIPVRFDVDDLNTVFTERVVHTNIGGERIYFDLNSIPLAEIKLD